MLHLSPCLFLVYAKSALSTGHAMIAYKSAGNGSGIGVLFFTSSCILILFIKLSLSVDEEENARVVLNTEMLK